MASLMAPSDTDAFLAASPGDELIQRLDDPALASSLSLILDHADLLAMLVVGLGGLLRRGDVISDSLVSALAEFKTAGASFTSQTLLPDVDVPELQSTVAGLASALIAAAPTINKVLRSPLTDPQTAHVLADVGEALLEGKAAAAEDPRGPKGVFALMRVTKDPDVSRGLGFMIQVARAFGKRLVQDPPRPEERGPRHSAN